MLDKKTFWTGILTLGAIVLLAVHATQPNALLPTADARLTVDNRDYAMATAEAVNGGEVLYVLEKRTGQLALVVWNNVTRQPVAVDVKPVGQAFGGAPNGR